jgi:quinol monooxygenase YgiN
MNADPAKDMQGQYVRLAELQIDPAQLESFNSAIKEGIETAFAWSQGFCCYMQCLKEIIRPASKFLKICTGENAYKTHLETPHFKKFRGIPERMVKSRKILDAVPIILSAKAK